MTSRILWKIFSSFVLVTVIVVFVLNFFVSLKLRDNLEQKITERLYDDAVLTGQLLKPKLLGNDKAVVAAESRAIATKLGVRVTVIDINGVVLGDSEEEPSEMVNHRDRPEVVQAFRDGYGQSTHLSETLSYHMKYVAVRVSDREGIAWIVRLSLALSEVQSEIGAIQRLVVLGGLLAVFTGLVISYLLSRSISLPISKMKDVAERFSKGDFSERLSTAGKDELGELAMSLNSMAQELEAKITNLKKLDRVRTDFVANVSHELRTPLTSIKGFVETLEDGAIDDKDKASRFLTIIDKHVRRLENIINDLLTLSELEQGIRPLDKEKFDIKVLIEEVAMGFGHALSAMDQELNLNCEGNDFAVVADRDKIEQIVVNLVDNAIKYTGQTGEIGVTLSAEADMVKITVEDNGVGIPHKHLERVFERFYRVDKARSREVGGTGLGLGIAKHIVLAHNGEIHIESEVGKGTKVFVSLPRE